MVSTTFERILRLYFHAEVTQDIEELRQFLNHENFPDRNRDFKRELYETIKNGGLSTDEFEKLTGLDYETQEEVNEFLVGEVWRPLYGDEPVKV